MSYYRNPNCPNPENSDNQIIPIFCGSKILGKDRYAPMQFLAAEGW